MQHELQHPVRQPLIRLQLDHYYPSTNGWFRPVQSSRKLCTELDRAVFEAELSQAAREAELKLAAPIRKAILSALSERNCPGASRHEQERIASFLDTQTARSDDLSAKVREAIDHLREFRTALISAAVTGKIDVREAAPR